MIELIRLFDELDFFMQQVRSFDESIQNNLSDVLAGKLINLTTCLKTAVAVYPSNNLVTSQHLHHKLDYTSNPSPALDSQPKFENDNSQFSTQQSDDRNSHITHQEHVMHVEQDLTPKKPNSRIKISLPEEWTQVTSKKKISRPTQTWYINSFSDQVSMDQHGQYNDTVNVQRVDNLTRTVSTGNDYLFARRPCLQNSFSALQDLEPDIDYF